MTAPALAVTTYIIGEQEEDFTRDGYCWECNDENPWVALMSNAPHGCGLNAPDVAIIHVIKPAHTQACSSTNDLNLEGLPF